MGAGPAERLAPGRAWGVLAFLPAAIVIGWAVPAAGQWEPLPSDVRAAEAAARARPRVRATITQDILVDEDRLWVTEILDLAPEGGQAVTLPSDMLRYGAPREAGAARSGGWGFGGMPMREVKLVDGAVLLPAEVPPGGISGRLEYSLPASGETAGLTLRLPFVLDEVVVTASARVAGVRVSISGAAPGETRAAGSSSWMARAMRTAPAAPGTPVRIVISGMPAYHLPLWSKGALVLAFHLAGLPLLNLGRKRLFALWRKQK